MGTVFSHPPKTNKKHLLLKIKGISTKSGNLDFSCHSSQNKKQKNKKTKNKKTKKQKTKFALVTPIATNFHLSIMVMPKSKAL